MISSHTEVYLSSRQSCYLVVGQDLHVYTCTCASVMQKNSHSVNSPLLPSSFSGWWTLPSLDCERNIRPSVMVCVCVCVAGLLCDLLWADPDKETMRWGENDRGVSFTFGPEIVSKFLTKHDLDLICRAHQVSVVWLMLHEYNIYMSIYVWLMWNAVHEYNTSSLMFGSLGSFVININVICTSGAPVH